MLADHFAVIHRFEIKTIALLNVDIEVIAPKLDHELVKLALAVSLPYERGLTQFVGDRFTVVVVEESIADGFQFIGIHVQCFEWMKQKFAVKIVDGLKRKLFLDPGCNPIS